MNQHWWDGVFCDATDIILECGWTFEKAFTKWLPGMCPTPWKFLAEIYICTRGLFWRICSLNYCTDLYFLQIKWFCEHFEHFTYYCWLCLVSWFSVVGIVTRYRLDSPGLKSWLGQEIFSYPKPSRGALGLFQAPIQWVPRFFPRDKVLGHDVNLSPPNRAKVKNEWSYNSPLAMYLYSMDRDNFTITFHCCLYPFWFSLCSLNRTVLPQPWWPVKKKDQNYSWQNIWKYYICGSQMQMSELMK